MLRSAAPGKDCVSWAEAAVGAAPRGSVDDGVDEGLRAGLNLQAGGRLASDLHDLYGYLNLRLTQANLRNDETALDECQRLIQPLRDAWNSISAQADRPAEH